MKLIVVALSVVFVAGAFAAPQVSSSGENDFVTEDDLSRKTIEKVLRDIELISGQNDVAKAIIKSVDRDCMLKKYKSHQLVEEMLTDEAIDLTTIDSEPKSFDSILVFANIALTCSNKLNSLLGFVFDNAFSYSGLIDAFRDDEPFNKFLDELNCYNSYAVRKNFLNASAHQHLNTELVNQTEAECDASIAELKDGLVSTMLFFSEAVVSNARKCLEDEVVAAAERFFFRYVLLIPTGLTDEQKKLEKVNFTHDALDTLEKLLVCNVKKSGTAKINEIAKDD